MELPLLEADLDAEGVLEPARLFANTDAPRRAVMCFFQEVVQEFGGRVHATMTSVYGGRPMYETQHGGERIAFFFPGVGAPAAAACMEEAIAMGCRGFIAVGGAGALVPNLTLGHAVVVDSAVRDEGTSSSLPGAEPHRRRGRDRDPGDRGCLGSGSRPVRPRTFMDHGCDLSRDPRARAAKGRGGVRHGRDGGRCILRHREIPERACWSAAVCRRCPARG